MNLKLPTPLLASAILLSISLLVPAFNFVIWIALVPFLLLVSEGKFVQIAGYGLVCGIAFFASLLYWITQYELRILMIVLAIAVPFFILFALTVRLLWNQFPQTLIQVLAVPISWFFIHFLYSFTPIEIIGNQIAFLQAPHFPGIVRIAGLSGVTFIVLLVNSLVTHHLSILRFHKRHHDRRAGALDLTHILLWLFISAFLLFGWISRLHFHQTAPVKVTLVQHNFTIDHQWRAQNKERIMKYYEETIARLGSTTDLIAFPQYGLPVDVLRNPEMFNALAQNLKTNIILATYIPKVSGEDVDFGEKTDSALVFSENGPVQEYQAMSAPPFRRIKEIFGSKQKLLHVKGLKAGVLLCYEDTNSHDTRNWTHSGAQILISLSNPGHFLGTPLPFYHLTHDRIRAIESGRYLIRVSPNGFSAIINPNGEFIKVSRLNQEEILNGVIFSNDDLTWFTRLGDWIPNACAAATVILLALFYVRDSMKRFARITR